LQQYIDRLRMSLEGKPPGYQINTYGCQMNAHDSEKIAGLLEECGFIAAADDPDLILFNTCCVREHAEARVFGNVGALREKKRENPGLIVGLCGCMMQQEGMAETIRRRFPYVDIVFGTHNLDSLPRMLYHAMVEQKKGYEVSQDEQILEGLPMRRQGNRSAYLTIMYGCDNFCTYCIVPYVRGRERSRAMQDILNEARELAEAGYKEITLLGQNVNSYGKDTGETDFSQLLRELDKIEDLEFIRFMTSHPKDLSDKLIRALEDCKRVAPHVHLPVQSGSNKILAAMNRGYTSEAYRLLARKLRAAVPNICLTTDIIVGFPGETEQDFQDTLLLMKDLRFTAAFTFMYSPRSGTPAATMENQIDKAVKKRRLWELNDLQEQIIVEDSPSFIGKTLRILVDGVSARNGEMKGKAGNTKTVFFPGTDLLLGEVVDVKITDVRQGSLVGEMVRKEQQ
jgi:tRNA-2-methylthio-N6-dimethylallyladenosine synthase